MEENGHLQPNKVEETLNGFIENKEDEEIKNLVRNEELFKLLCESLIRSFEPLERREAAFERLLEVMRRLSLRSEYLQQLVDAWLPNRHHLVSTIEDSRKTMNIMTKACNSSRVVTSIIDTTGLVGGLFIGESNERYSNLLFNAANFCRIVGFSASALELFNWKTVLEKLMKLLQNDQALLAPIQAFFLQDTELEEAMKALFPFEITGRLVKEFQRAIDYNLNQSEILQIILRPLLMEDVQRLRDINLIRNLVAFSTCPEARDWCRWILLRHHKVSLDIETLLLQLINPQRIISSQSVGLTARGGDKPPILTIFSRIALNCVTLYDAINSLRDTGMVKDLEQLENHLQLEMATVVQISRLLQLRTRQQ